MEAGPRGVTTAAVSVRSGAPTGSLYHRFGSRAAMVAELWVRTIRRFHAFLFEATSDVEPGLPRDAGFYTAWHLEKRLRPRRRLSWSTPART